MVIRSRKAHTKASSNANGNIYDIEKNINIDSIAKKYIYHTKKHNVFDQKSIRFILLGLLLWTVFFSSMRGNHAEVNLVVHHEDTGSGNTKHQSREEITKDYGSMGQEGRNDQASVELTVMILTYQKHKNLEKLLPSVLSQRPYNFEVIIVGNGCFDQTKAVVNQVFDNHPSVPHKYLPICGNAGYSGGNNAGVELASPTSKHILFLNDDVVLSDSSFIQNMMSIAQSKENSAAAVGCKLLDADGKTLIEAGSIVWKDGSASGYGRGRKNLNAPEISYPRPVDYVSGACLLVEKKMFDEYGGFDREHFPNYYEDTDLQLHIQHDLGREVWYQPKSVARHDEHSSFGSDGKESEKLMQKAAKVFAEKWRDHLEAKHLDPPRTVKKEGKQRQYFLAADLRARDPKKANILYLDERAPNKAMGSGFGRSFDNLSMIAELGHRVTLITSNPLKRAMEWCDNGCEDEIIGLGVEYVNKGEWDEFVQARLGYYDIVIISRPTAMLTTYPKWKHFYGQSPFWLIYDCEALSFRRDEMLYNIVQKENIVFPGYKQPENSTLQEAMGRNAKRIELGLISMADTVISVSDQEKILLSTLSPNTTNIHTIGHVMSLKRSTKKKFYERNGILFLASFGDTMYYNGDAIWYFLKEIYPLILEESPSSAKLSLTIAGRGIPKKLQSSVLENDVIAPHVYFVDSPHSVESLYEEHRIFIAPHLYGAGIQFKVSEAMSFGLPVVMSTFTKESFGDAPGCVGSDNRSFANCVLDLHGREDRWEAMQNAGIAYIEKTHNRQKTLNEWSNIINDGLKRMSMRNRGTGPGVGTEHGLFKAQMPESSTQECAEGEEMYLAKYADIAAAVKSGHFRSGFHHWSLYGKNEGRIYNCSM